MTCTFISLILELMRIVLDVHNGPSLACARVSLALLVGISGSKHMSEITLSRYLNRSTEQLCIIHAIILLWISCSLL